MSPFLLVVYLPSKMIPPDRQQMAAYRFSYYILLRVVGSDVMVIVNKYIIQKTAYIYTKKITFNKKYNINMYYLKQCVIQQNQ